MESKLICKSVLEKELDNKSQCHYKSKTISFFNYGFKNSKINLNPSYQRGEVWCNSGKVFLINSLLCGISIPPIILNQADMSIDKFEVIDGKQRISTILGFINNNFPVIIGQKKIYFSKIPDDLIENDNSYILDEDYKEHFKQIEVQVTVYISLDEIKQREIFERINYGSPLKYGEKLKGSNSKGLYLIEKLISNFSTNFEQIGIKNERHNYYLKFGTIIALINNDFKSASSGSPTLNYFKKWEKTVEESEKIYDNTYQIISKLIKLYENISKYHFERENKNLTKQLWNWSELLFNIYCINTEINFERQIKFNKFLYHWKFTKRTRSSNNTDLNEFDRNWEELGRKNTNKESIYINRVELMNNIIQIIEKPISKKIKDKLRLIYFRNSKKLDCPTCSDNKNTINKNNFDSGHIISRNNGGMVHETNLRPICGKCNSTMGSQDMDTYCLLNKINISL